MKDLVDILKNTRQHLMNGVSHMIPVVVSGGILFAIAAMLSMNSVQTSASVPQLPPAFAPLSIYHRAGGA